MGRRQTKHASTELPHLLNELAFATPQVIAARLWLIASAGPNLSKRDQKEMFTMINEKVAGFTEAWHTLWLESLRLQNRMFFDAISMNPATPDSTAAMFENWQKIAFSALPATVLAPIHKRATANARRLSR